MSEKGPRIAQEFNSLSAAHLLVNSPKFASKIGGSSGSFPSRTIRPVGVASAAVGFTPVVGGGGDPAQESGQHRVSSAGEEDVVAAVPAAQPSPGRLIGVKHFKAAGAASEASDTSIDRVAQSVSSMREALTACRRKKADLASLHLEAKLVEMLDPGEEKQIMVRALLQGKSG